MAGNPCERSVREFVTSKLIWAGLEDTVQEALGLMVENRISALPVLDGNGACVGVLSSSDILELTREADEALRQFDDYSSKSQWLLETLSNYDLGHQRVRELMSESPVTIGSEISLAEAAREMIRSRVHRLPVVDGEQLVGILSTMDIVAAVAEAADGDRGAKKKRRPTAARAPRSSG